MKKIIILILILTVFACKTTEKLYELDKETLQYKQTNDLESIKLCRDGLNHLLIYMDAHSEIFSSKKLKKSKMLLHDQRETTLTTWKAALEYYFALDSIQSFHKDFLLLKDKTMQNKSFYLSAYSFMTEYSFALELISRLEKNPHFDILLNEPLENMDLPGGMYDKFKFRFLNVGTAALFAGFDAGLKFYKTDDREILKNIEKDKKIIIAKAKQGAPIMTLENGLNIIQTTNDKMIFPVQKGVSTFMGDTKVYRLHKYLITGKQIHSFMKEIQPGDIFLERREWYLTNAGIPGFWTHAVMYVGTKEEREHYFNDPEVSAWLSKNNYRNFENYLEKTYPQKYEEFNSDDTEGNPYRIIESVSEGVIFTSIEHSANCDSIAVLRPKLSRKEKAIAISRAFFYTGRPYDFNFNFESDSTLVCTELVYKSYEKGKDISGLKLPLEDILGRKLLSANAIAKLYDSEKSEGNGQFEFILFYDGNEKEKKSFPSTENEFRKTWKRPKWHVIMQK
ncbi:MAG: hypothetical protein JW982_04345 [Spirochaetes bacterium]|nr:hypothetical protein [Spirochaetota bacterium]